MSTRFSDNTVFRFTIKAVGPSRSETEIRQDVAHALAEALRDYKSQFKSHNVRAEAEPEGPFTGVELAALWLLKIFVGGVVAGGGGAAGKELYDCFAAALRKRNLDPGPPLVANQGEADKKPRLKRKPRSRKRKS
jgi:hypothetical protein